MAVSQATLDAMKARMPDVLGHYGIENTGSNFRAFWREDTDPSATYYPDTNLVYDHGAGEAYDVFALAGKIEGVEGFRDQVDLVAAILGEQVEEGGPAKRKRSAKRPTYTPPERKGFEEDVREECMRACGILLSGDGSDVERAREWLRGRGFTDSGTWIHFGLGFVPAYRHKDIHPSFRVKEDEAVGFVSIPHFGASGEVHYCALRTVMSRKAEHGPIKKEWVPKNVGKPLYNEHYLGIGLETVAVCEGPVDAISLAVMTGVPTVGLNGTSMSTRFCQVFYFAKPEQRPKRVIVNLDANDEHGEKAAKEIASFLDGMGVDHSELKMPPGIKDANEWLQLRAGVA